MAGYECLEWGKVCTPKCGNGHVEGAMVTVTVGAVSTTSFVADGEECDLGQTLNNINRVDVAAGQEDTGRNTLAGYNALKTYKEISDLSPELRLAEVKKYACSSDCKLIEALAEDNLDDTTKAATPKVPKKWNCVTNTTPIASAVPTNPDRTVHKMTCTYLCGNRFLDITDTVKE